MARKRQNPKLVKDASLESMEERRVYRGEGMMGSRYLSNPSNVESRRYSYKWFCTDSSGLCPKLILGKPEPIKHPAPPHMHGTHVILPPPGASWFAHGKINIPPRYKHTQRQLKDHRMRHISKLVLLLLHYPVAANEEENHSDRSTESGWHSAHISLHITHAEKERTKERKEGQRKKGWREGKKEGRNTCAKSTLTLKLNDALLRSTNPVTDVEMKVHYELHT